ncbi:hypothetical protein GFY24_25430 [Nocardia sp. SYP-A9097]|uniref:hypothetical protein n=1 Tax=Nocardia sp. SYP-A9097 TaxID=2663237 RepID=UPI00129BBC92|nr:hypothetical protein [Nocardia sp. SYP-A9097]MRH90740.1 hypothetical protein [Nocardia sp. SYP-A9097]
MRIPRTLAPFAGALTLTAVLAGTVLTPTLAHADEADTLAATEISDQSTVCAGGAMTFDNVVTAAATALRGSVPAEQAAGFDRQVADFRATLVNTRVHRDGLPVDSATLGERAAFLDDPIVSYLVNGLDAVRTGRIDQTMSVSRLTVVDAVEVFILATGIVKIPAKLIASMVPTVGMFLKPIVSALFSGVKSLAHKIRSSLAANCAVPNDYPALVVDESAVAFEPVQLPEAIVALANTLVRADGVCTPVAELTVTDLVERTRAYLNTVDLQLDRASMNASADSLQTFLAENRVARSLLMRRSEELGPLVDALHLGPVTFLANLGFDIAQGRVFETAPLAEVRVENALDLSTLVLDTASLLVGAGGGATGPAGDVAKVMQKLAFAPTDYGVPIVKGVMQTMCAV